MQKSPLADMLLEQFIKPPVTLAEFYQMNQQIASISDSSILQELIIKLGRLTSSKNDFLALRSAILLSEIAEKTNQKIQWTDTIGYLLDALTIDNSSIRIASLKTLDAIIPDDQLIDLLNSIPSPFLIRPSARLFEYGSERGLILLLECTSVLPKESISEFCRIGPKALNFLSNYLMDFSNPKRYEAALAFNSILISSGKVDIDQLLHLCDSKIESNDSIRIQIVYGISSVLNRSIEINNSTIQKLNSLASREYDPQMLHAFMFLFARNSLSFPNIDQKTELMDLIEGPKLLSKFEKNPSEIGAMLLEGVFKRSNDLELLKEYQLHLKEMKREELVERLMITIENRLGSPKKQKYFA